jgi:hypothetical protein
MVTFLEERMRSPQIDNKGLVPVAPEDEIIAAVSAAPASSYEAPPQEKPKQIEGWYGERARLMGVYSVKAPF